MSDRSLKATVEGIKIAKNTLTGKAISQEKFANDLNVARSTVSNFFTGKPVDRQIFVQLCDNLGLSWEEISGDSILPISSTAEKEASEEDKVKAKQIAADHISAGRDIHLNISQVIANEFTQSAESTSLPNISIEELVQIVRARCEVDIQEQCGTMRVLDMEHPISLNEIYTDVNILEKLTRNQRKGVEELLARFRADDFSRWGLGEKQERIEGIAAVYRHSKLMILGKPGAGKTTFLKFLATACINGNLFAERVPVFVTLKDFADTENTSSLLGFIVRQFEQYGIAETTQVKRGLFDSLLNRDVNAMETLLRKGKMLVLLDGLDEVREKDDERVVREIRRFSQHYSQSQIVVTCRIAAKQYTFEQFTEVEIADFDEQQITTFSGNWFRHKQVKAKDFLAELKKYGGVEELATSPLLLTLLCLAFEESGNFPANRAELYKEGLDALLRKWDSKRGIRRDSVYRDLSVQKKEDMLSQIALTTFEKGDYFIKQRQLEEYICGYIRNTANAKTDDDELHLDSEVVLKSIEAQHGLFVERARGIYSFSHLTFHEYFAARQLMLSSTPSKLESALQKLITHITDKQWREVILLSVCMAREADELLLLMKREIDNLLADNDNLQSFLQSINQQSRSVAKSPYSLATTRAYYFDLNLARSIDANLDKDITRTLELENILAVAIDLDQSLDIAVHIDYILDRSIVLDEENSTNKEISRYKSDFQFLLHYRRLYTDLSLARIRRCYRIDRDFLYFNPTNDVDRILYHILEKDKSIYESLGDINGVHQIANDEITYDHIRTLTNEFSQDLASKVFNIKGVIHDRLNPRLQNLKDNFPDPIDWRAFTEWWKANGREWISELRKVLAEYSKSGYKWQLTKKQKYLLNQYSEANKLLVECLKSDCYVSRETRREIEDNLLFPIKK